MAKSHLPPPVNGNLVPELEIIFSLREGQVWASWPGTSATVRLGSYEAVLFMMRDFLAQDAVGNRMIALGATTSTQNVARR